jgi:hypothetical protein
MSLESPSTYADWYWKWSVEANKSFRDAQEQVLSPYVQKLLSLVSEIDGFPEELIAPLKDVGSPGHFGVADVAVNVSAESAHGGLMAGVAPLLRSVGYSANKRTPTQLVNPETASLMNSRHKLTDEAWHERMLASGFASYEGGLFYHSVLPYPDFMSIIQWARYVTDDAETFTKAQSKQDIDDEDFQIWEFMTRLRLTPTEVRQLHVRGYLEEDTAKLELKRQGYEDANVAAMLELGYEFPNAMLLTQAGLLKQLDDDEILTDISKAGIHPDYAKQYLDAVLTKPSAQDLIRFQLRNDPDLNKLDTELKKVGIHPEYLELYKTLAYDIPPVQDLITMAVREAFSPGIALRFGQYDDFPPDFEYWAKRKGLSSDWARRYWAAHWNLPSPQQGFEMLHRGVITADDLDLLLRAQDVMPFWRDKLVKIAYNPLTRIDIRRMYRLGVLSERDVLSAYKQIGYNENNADRLTQFTVQEAKNSVLGFSSKDIVNAYVNRQLSSRDAQNMLIQLGVTPDNAAQAINTAGTKRDLDFRKDQVAAIGNQYRKKLITEPQARSQLASTGMAGNDIEITMQRWAYREAAETEPTWTTAQTLSFLKKGLINRERAEAEFRLLGYSPERIAIYLQSVAQA